MSQESRGLFIASGFKQKPQMLVNKICHHPNLYCACLRYSVPRHLSIVAPPCLSLPCLLHKFVGARTQRLASPRCAVPQVEFFFLFHRSQRHVVLYLLFLMKRTQGHLENLFRCQWLWEPLLIQDFVRKTGSITLSSINALFVELRVKTFDNFRINL